MYRVSKSKWRQQTLLYFDFSFRSTVQPTAGFMILRNYIMEQCAGHFSLIDAISSSVRQKQNSSWAMNNQE